MEGKYTNHSLRATSVTRLFDAGVDEQLIMAHTGHSSTSGVRSYKRITEKLQEITSSVLNTGGELIQKAKIDDYPPCRKASFEDEKLSPEINQLLPAGRPKFNPAEAVIGKENVLLLVDQT